MLYYLEYLINGSLSTKGPDVVDTYKQYWKETDDKYGKEPKDLGYGSSSNDEIFQHQLYIKALAHNYDGSYYTAGLDNRRKSEWKAFCYGYCDKINKYFSASSSDDNNSDSSDNSNYNSNLANTIVQKAIEIHKQLRNYTYSTATSRSIPIVIESNKTIDCSSYVSDVLYWSRI